MKKIIVLIIMLLIASTAHSAYWVCQDGDTLRRKQGDGTLLGIATKNYETILPNCILATKEQYDEAGLQYKKLEGGDVVDWTQQEIDNYLQEQSDLQAQAEEDALNNYEVSNIELLTALVQRINVRIPSNPITKAEIIQQIKDNR